MLQYVHVPLFCSLIDLVGPSDLVTNFTIIADCSTKLSSYKISLHSSPLSSTYHVEFYTILRLPEATNGLNSFWSFSWHYVKFVTHNKAPPVHPGFTSSDNQNLQRLDLRLSIHKFGLIELVINHFSHYCTCSRWTNFQNMILLTSIFCYL